MVVATGAIDVVVVLDGPHAVVGAIEQESGTPVLALTDVADRRSVSVLLAAGADGIAMTTDSDEVLGCAVRALMAGFVLVPGVARNALQPPILTARQKQILSLVVLGLRNGEIAQRLFVTEATIKGHLTTIFAKLGVASRKDAIQLILDPTSGLGAGILHIAETQGTQQGYGAPVVSD